MFREYQINDFDELLRLRCLLYFDYTKQELYDELTLCVQGNPYYDLYTAFVYQCEDENLGGFIEIGFVKADNYKERLTHFTSTAYYEQIQKFLSSNRPIPVVESWYVDEDLRGNKIGITLMSLAEKWVKDNGYPFILSDTDDFRDISKKAHKSFGYDTYHVDEDGCNFFYKRIV